MPDSTPPQRTLKSLTSGFHTVCLNFATRWVGAVRGMRVSRFSALHAFRLRRGKDRARPGCVLGDLRFQRVETGEAACRADEIDQRDAQVASVEIGVDVEQVGFEPRLRR